MTGLTRGRTAFVAAVVCAGLGVAATLAVQANARGNGSTPAARPPVPTSVPELPGRPRTAAEAHVAATTATNATCGQTITKSLTLNGDLSCVGNGLTLSGSSVVLNLNGHYISGSGSPTTNGVRLTGATQTVKNGVVTLFGFGVRAEGTNDTVSAVRSTFAGIVGIGDYGQGTKITDSVVYGSAGDGIYSLSSGSTYSGVHELNNTGTGLVLGGGGATDVTVTHNVANGNAEFGIYDFDLGTTLTGNTADFNARDGIYVDEVAGIDGGGNNAKGNDYGSGATTVQCTHIVCS